jgi:tartrate/fumarate subfamily iron-sulfur-dependent hydro-lyase beta chain
MKRIHLTIPLSRQEVLTLAPGDLVFLTGPVFTARSLFHIRAVRERILPPIDFKKLNVMVHMGPMMKKTRLRNTRWIPVSCEPTTSLRFEKPAAEVIRTLGLRAIVGKGSMGEKTVAAMKACGCVHLSKIGISGNILASRITRILGVHGLRTLGPIECTWVMEVRDFGPFLVDIDAHGRNFFEKIDRSTQKRLVAAYRGLCLTPFG